MKKFMLFAVIIFMNGTLFSQITFEKFFDEGSADYGTSVIETSNGYLFCGTILDDLNGDYDVFVTSTNLNGVVNWTNIYTSLGTGDDIANYINATSDGKFVITGNTTDPASGDEDVFILKINALGTEIWTKTYDGGTSDDDGANYIVEGDGNTLLVCGYSYDGSSSDMWVFQTNSTGTLVWEDFLGLNGDDEAFSLMETSDNGLAVVGESYDDVNGDIDGVLVKIDSLGVEEWTYYTTGTGDESFNDIITDSYGDFLIVGKEEYVSGSNSDYDILIENVSFDGTSIYYSDNYDYSGGDDEAVRVYADGSDVYIAGQVEDNNNDFNAYFAHINDANGSIIGDVVYGGIFEDSFLDFDFTSDNGFICIGYSEVSSTDVDVYLVKTDEDGLVTKITQSFNSIGIDIYPNPVQDYLNISGIESFDKLEIINSTGQVIMKTSEYSKSLDLKFLNNGVYFISIYTDGNKYSSKFVKQ